MKFGFIAPVCAGALVVASAFAGPAIAGGPSNASTPIVVAVEAPLSGPQKANGRDMLRGVRLAARQVNASGGVLGRRIKVVPVDDRANPDLAASVVDEAADAGAAPAMPPISLSPRLHRMTRLTQNLQVHVRMITTELQRQDVINL